jgi:hypothetical protein
VKDWARGVDGIKNGSAKCERPDGRGVNGLKNRSEKCEGPAKRRKGGGGTNGCLN